MCYCLSWPYLFPWSTPYPSNLLQKMLRYLEQTSQRCLAPSPRLRMRREWTLNARFLLPMDLLNTMQQVTWILLGLGSVWISSNISAQSNLTPLWCSKKRWRKNSYDKLAPVATKQILHSFGARLEQRNETLRSGTMQKSARTWMSRKGKIPLENKARNSSLTLNVFWL